MNNVVVFLCNRMNEQLRTINQIKKNMLKEKFSLSMNPKSKVKYIYKQIVKSKIAHNFVIGKIEKCVHHVLAVSSQNRLLT
jgi:hypothetical protein